VVSDVASWGHLTKPVLEQNGYVVSRVELYLGATYPVFFVEPSPGAKPLLERAVKDPWPVRLFAHALLRENGGYPLEIVEGREIQERYRYRGRDRMFQRLVGADWKEL